MTRSMAGTLVKVTITAALMGGLVSCASYTDETRKMNEAYAVGNYDAALESLKKSGVMERTQDRLLWRLEAATIFDRKGEPEKSRNLWFEADQLVDELYTVSVSKTAASFIMSDSSADYEGEDYEKVAIHSMLAHQYIGLGKLDEARVEARRINTKLSQINEKYDEKNKNKYGEDAHARYLSAMIYEARGEWDSAIIDYSKSLELYEGPFGRYIKGSVPSGVVMGLYRTLSIRNRTEKLKPLVEKYSKIIGGETVAKAADSQRSDGEIVVIHELGRVAKKVAKDFVLPISGQIVRFSFPELRPKPVYDAGTGVDIQGKGFFRAENTAYMDAIASDVLESRRGRMVAKQMTRLLAKGQLNYQVEKNFGPLAGLAANVFTAATETADTRSWTTLPQAFYVTRARVAPGDYQIVVKTNGRVNVTKHVAVKKGQIEMLRAWD
jgi:hypothetical protein